MIAKLPFFCIIAVAGLCSSSSSEDPLEGIDILLAAADRLARQSTLSLRPPRSAGTRKRVMPLVVAEPHLLETTAAPFTDLVPAKRVRTMLVPDSDEDPSAVRPGSGTSFFDNGLSRRLLVRDFLDANRDRITDNLMLKELELMLKEEGVTPINRQSLMHVVRMVQKDLGLTEFRPQQRISEWGQRRMEIVTEFVKAHPTLRNTEMVPNITALFEANGVPTVLPTSVEDQISKARRELDLALKRSPTMQSQMSAGVTRRRMEIVEAVIRDHPDWARSAIFRSVTDRCADEGIPALGSGRVNNLIAIARKRLLEGARSGAS